MSSNVGVMERTPHIRRRFVAPYSTPVCYLIGFVVLMVSCAAHAQPASKNVVVVPEDASSPPEQAPADSTAGETRYVLQRRTAASTSWQTVTIADQTTYPRAGDYVRLCVTPAHSGYATLWVTDSTGHDQLLWPNSVEPADISGDNTSGEKVAARRVEAGRQVCPGDTGSKPSIRASIAKDNPSGDLELYYHWTPSPETQLGVKSYAASRGRPRSRQVIVVGEENATSTGSEDSINLRFRVLDGG